jgi:prepilin-type N-terminal cleavage/methylation domain-containing protein
MRRRGAFTLIELLAVVAVVAILASLLVTTIASSIERGRRAACMQKLAQLHIALMNFAAEHDGKIPMGRPTGWPGYFWHWRNGGPFRAMELANVIAPDQSLYCPTQKDGRFRYGDSANSLGGNRNQPHRAGYTLRPSRFNGWDEQNRTIDENLALMPHLATLTGRAIAADVFGVGDWTTDPGGGPNGSPTTHAGGLHVLYANGAVKWVQATAFAQYTATPGWGNDYRNILDEFVNPPTGIWAVFDSLL